MGDRPYVCTHFTLRARGDHTVKAWHELTCPAVMVWAPENRCDCGGSDRAHRAHAEAVRTGRERP